jgi:hypothetical protein
VLGPVVILPTGALGVIDVIGVIGVVAATGGLLQGGRFADVELEAAVGACTTVSAGMVTGAITGALMLTLCVNSSGGVAGAFTSDGGVNASMLPPVR